MKAIVNLSETLGRIKPMHAVNNGPVYKFSSDQRITNLQAFKEAGIPYARTHDASFCSTYGGEHTVDVNFIFQNFDADPYDPASYDFALTDEYMKIIKLGGSEIFYRLGSKIEHQSKKYNTLPPKDFHKWAVICEHIIKHLNYGWADGHEFGIKYFEIWNEPDMAPDDSKDKKTWGGTEKEFFEFYDVAATHLKKCFPELKIGGPALCCNLEWAERFIKQLKAPLDFFSWHAYGHEVMQFVESSEKVRRLLDENGFENTESILDEWNYVRGWTGDEWIYSLKTEKNHKGAALISSVMLELQKSDVDMLMYYDARPCGMNGLFGEIVSEKLKGYYAIYMFGELYKLGVETASKADGRLSVCSAKNDRGDKAAVMLSYFDDDDNAKSEKVCVEIKGLAPDTLHTFEIYLLDERHDFALLSTFATDGSHCAYEMPLEPNSVLFIKLADSPVQSA